MMTLCLAPNVRFHRIQFPRTFQFPDSPVFAASWTVPWTSLFSPLIVPPDARSWKLVKALCASSSGEAEWQPACRVLHAAEIALDNAEDDGGQSSPDLFQVDAFFAPKPSNLSEDEWKSSRAIETRFNVAFSINNEENESNRPDGFEEGAGFRVPVSAKVLTQISDLKCNGNWSPGRPSVRQALDAKLVSQFSVPHQHAALVCEKQDVNTCSAGEESLQREQDDMTREVVRQLQEKEASARARALEEHDKRRREAEEARARAKEDDKKKLVVEIASARARARDELARKEAEGM